MRRSCASFAYDAAGRSRPPPHRVRVALAQALDVALVQRWSTFPRKSTRSRTVNRSLRATSGTRPFDEQVVEGASILTTDLDNVAKAVRGDECDTRKLEIHLAEQRVCCDRRRMREQLDPRRLFISVKIAAIASTTARCGSRGVLATLRVRIRPLQDSAAARSVKVPPTSIPMRSVPGINP